MKTLADKWGSSVSMLEYFCIGALSKAIATVLTYPLCRVWNTFNFNFNAVVLLSKPNLESVLQIKVSQLQFYVA